MNGDAHRPAPTTSVSRLLRTRPVRSLRGGGSQETVRRLARRAYRTTGAAALDFPLRPEDVVDSTTLRARAAPASPTIGGRPTVGWVCAPPGPGSGGHTTMFRMIAALEAAGYRCVVALHDPFGVDLARYTRVIRTHWPAVAATVVDVDDGLPSTAAWIATSWPTAHVLGARPGVGGERFYFVQDYEPYFHPAGSEYALAEDTYRFGFRILALGRMVRDEIARAVGVESTLVPFGLDTTVYRFLGSRPRRGIAFYSRPDTPRRGSVLAGLALDRFHALRPDHPIHLVGDRPPHMTAPVIAHGRLDPDGLAALYNATVCGLGLSFTNSSLVVEEMAACGVQVVVNDAPGARADVTHPGVTWVQPGPSAIANALCAAVDADPSTIAARAQRTADASCMPAWSDAGAVLVEAIERVLTRSGARS